MKTEFSSIRCVADVHITKALEQCLAELEMPEVFVQRAKQMSLLDKQGFLGLRPVSKLEESRALLYRISLPSVYETGLINRIVEAADLKLGGRGCIVAQRVSLIHSMDLRFNTEKLEKLCGRSKVPKEEHALIACIVPRGLGDALAEAVLELGICVPVVFFGVGMGFRDKLGLLRITIPVEKEIIWFVVPSSDALLVEKTIILQARLDIPGRGFLYRINVHAPVVNLRVRHGKRSHAATMEQVIAALDEVRGSSDWRRVSSKNLESEGKSKSDNTRALFFIGEEEDVKTFRQMAMENGARGATLSEVEMRSYIAKTQEQIMESHSRSLCDIITSRSVEEKVLEHVTQSGLFGKGRTCVLKTFDVELSSAMRR